MGDDKGKQEFRLPFPFEDELSKLSETVRDMEIHELEEPDLSAEECKFGDWMFSSKDVVLRNLRKRKTIRLENIVTAQRLLSAMIALALHPGYQLPQFVAFLDRICRFHFGKSLADVFCSNEPNDTKEVIPDWESIKRKTKIQNRISEH